MEETILVTGGAGFIGSWTVEKLVSKNYNVVVIDNLESGSINNIEHLLDKIVFIRGDIRDKNLLLETCRKHGVVKIVHLAALVSVEKVSENPIKGVETNIVGTLNVLETARLLDIEKIVYASSAAVYGEPVKIPIDEDHPLNPKNVYGATKLGGEALVNSYRENYGLKTISLRYFNVYGPRMQYSDYAGVIIKFIINALMGKPLTIYGTGEQTRDFVYVEDVADANIQALESKITGVFNIGTGIETSINTLAKKIIELTNSKSKIIHTQPRPGDIMRSVANIDRAKKILGWNPRKQLTQGLLKTIKYYKAATTNELKNL